ncbi:GNAT family N-acetyltransferase [Chloroflexota bacterium]
MEKFTYKITEDDIELRGAFQVRQQVFTGEQSIAEDLVFDGNDDEAVHLIVKDKESVIGTARVRFTGQNQAKLERMAVLSSFRGQGIGRGIISFLTTDLNKKQFRKLIIHAQYEVIGFYEACGFRQVGIPFWEAGIKHVQMELKL